MNSKKIAFAGLISMVALTGCLVPGRHGEPVLLAPPLPSIVVLGPEPYYVQEGYHYHYRDDGWYYARTRNGPWSNLPRDHYPREVRFKDGGRGRDGGRNPGHNRR